MGSDPERLVMRPWGAAAALLTACIITLLGVIRGFDPWWILQRASVAAIIVGSIVAVASTIAARFFKV